MGLGKEKDNERAEATRPRKPIRKRLIGSVEREALARSATLRAGLRQRGKDLFFRYPALISQRASAPRKRGRARLFRP